MDILSRNSKKEFGTEAAFRKTGDQSLDQASIPIYLVVLEEIENQASRLKLALRSRLIDLSVTERP